MSVLFHKRENFDIKINTLRTKSETLLARNGAPEDKDDVFQLIMENLHSLRCEAGSWSGGQCWCAAGPLVQETVARTGEPGDQISSVRGHHPPHLHPRTSPSAIRCTERRQPVETQPTLRSHNMQTLLTFCHILTSSYCVPLLNVFGSKRPLAKE